MSPSTWTISAAQRAGGGIVARWQGRAWGTLPSCVGLTNIYIGTNVDWMTMPETEPKSAAVSALARGCARVEPQDLQRVHDERIIPLTFPATSKLAMARRFAFRTLSSRKLFRIPDSWTSWVIKMRHAFTRQVSPSYRDLFSIYPCFSCIGLLVCF